jgi:hypothetical protein
VTALWCPLNAQRLSPEDVLHERTELSLDACAPRTVESAPAGVRLHAWLCEWGGERACREGEKGGVGLHNGGGADSSTTPVTHLC